MNEENVKLRVLDLLKSWGFEPNELKLEESFTIKFGKNAVKIDSLKPIEESHPRSDILVTKDDKNLFIFELKASNIKINDDDISQGISYARLTKQITPYVIITNGTDIRIFNAYNNEELKSNDSDITVRIKELDYTLSLDLDIQDLQYQATKYLIGMSPQNLAIFCNQQIESRMDTLRGNNIDSDEKYITELYVKREMVYDEFEEFLNSDNACFSIVGESGSGKTNLICDLALEYASDRKPDFLSYFYSCHELYNDILENIKEDFNLNFVQQNSVEQIIKKLSDISEKKTIIFFDAVDEKNDTDFSIEFNNFVRIAKDNGIKICYTCKDLELERFVKNRDKSTILAKYAYSCKSDSKNTGVSFSLDNFSDSEYELIKAQYIEKYNLNTLPKELDYELRNGFMLRIFSEVHKNNREYKAHNMIEVMEEYLDQKLSKINKTKGDKEKALNTLVETGRYIWENSLGKDINIFPISYRLSDRISETKLKENMGLRFDEIISPELFEYKILQRKNDDDDYESYISFYYTRFRDFIIGFKYLKINNLSDKEFKEKIHDFYSSNIGISIIQWYYNFAPENHKKIIEQYFIGKIFVFINEYNRLIDKYFKEIKSAIFPNIIEKIGIGFVKEPTNPSYFLYPAQHDQDIITIFDNNDKFRKTWQITGGIATSLAIDEETNLKTKAFTRLIEDVYRLLENPYKGGFGGDFYPKYFPKSKLTVQNNQIILNERLTIWFRQYAEEFNFAQRPIELIGYDMHSSYYHILPLDINNIESKIEELQSKPEKHYKNNLNLKTLESMINNYKKFSNIVDPVLPEGDIEEKVQMDLPNNKSVEFKKYEYSKSLRNTYISKWFEKKYYAYISLVEENFPKIKHYLPTYYNLPIRINYNIQEHKDEKIFNSLSCGFYYLTLINQKQNEKIKLLESENLGNDPNEWFSGSCLMPPYPETIEENAIKLLGDDLKIAFKEIAEEENIEIPNSYHIPIFMF